MNRLIPTLTTTTLLIGLVSTNAIAQMAGQIRLDANPSVDAPGPDGSTYENAAFACTYVQMKGEVLAATTSPSGAWSINTMPVADGKRAARYPVIASLMGADGVFRTVLPALLNAKVDIKAGETIRSGGYEITAKRTVHVGDAIPVLVVGGVSVLSVEVNDGATNAREATPWFTAFKVSAAEESARRAAIGAWRAERVHVGNK